MKSFKRIQKTIISALLIFITALPLFGLNAMHVTAQEAQAPKLILDDSFAPTRCDIPNYLSHYSSYKGETIKKIWAKVFYEEHYWNSEVSKSPFYYFYDENYDAWYKKYNHGYKDGQQVPVYFVSTDGSQKQLDHQITYSTGDFEAFFGNTLEANPEFLGQMLGLDNYDKLGESEAGNQLMTKIMLDYMSDPEKYKILSQRICSLTKEGLYIGDSNTADNNILKNKKDGNGVSYDIYMLLVLASMYEGDGDETYLSKAQVDWIKSYELYLYDEYASKGNGSLAKKYPALYDLIARSSYASNNRHGKGQEFFNYVVASETGAGLWINQIKGVAIPGLEDVDSLRNLYIFSRGYCFGHHTNCVNPTKCKDVKEGGEAVLADEICYFLYTARATAGEGRQNPTTYISNNPTLKLLYHNPQNPDGGWLDTFIRLHTPGQPAPAKAYALQAYAVHGGNSVGPEDQACTHGWATYAGDADSKTWATASIVLRDIDEDARNSGQPLSKTTCVSFTKSGSGNKDAATIQSYSVTINGVAVNPSLVPRDGTTFYLNNLNYEQRLGCVININMYSHDRIEGGAYNGGRNYGCDAAYHDSRGQLYKWEDCCNDAKAVISTSPVVSCVVNHTDCFMNGHAWRASVDWAQDYSTAVVTYTCKNDVKHKIVTAPIKATTRDEGNYYVHTVSCEPFMYDKEKGCYATFSERIPKNTSVSTVETIGLDAANTSGALSSSRTSSEKVYPGGASSKYHYKATSTATSFTIKPGVIKSGTKSVTLNYQYSEDLEELTIQVIDKYGKVLATNDPAIEANKVYLTYCSDLDLQDCYVTVTIKASTTNWSHSPYVLWEHIDDAKASVSASSVVLSYK